MSQTQLAHFLQVTSNATSAERALTRTATLTGIMLDVAASRVAVAEVDAFVQLALVTGNTAPGIGATQESPNTLAAVILKLVTNATFGVSDSKSIYVPFRRRFTKGQIFLFYLYATQSTASGQIVAYFQ